MNKKHEKSGLVYNYFNFSKFNFTDEEFNKLSADRKNKTLQVFQQNKWTHKGKI